MVDESILISKPWESLTKMLILVSPVSPRCQARITKFVEKGGLFVGRLDLLDSNEDSFVLESKEFGRKKLGLGVYVRSTVNQYSSSLLDKLLNHFGIVQVEQEHGNTLIHVYNSDHLIEGMVKAGSKTFDVDLFYRHAQSDVTLLHAESVGSTQTYFLTHSEYLNKLKPYSVFVADHQTEGKGRHSNQWISFNRNLQFTTVVYLPIDCKIVFAQYLVAITIHQTLNSSRIRLKWPNDIYSDQGDKLGGILINSCFTDRFQLLVGVGINFDSSSAYKSIKDFGVQIGREEFLGKFLYNLQKNVSEYINRGFTPFEEYYYKVWLHSNQRVSIEGVDHWILGLDKEGFLSAKNGNGMIQSLEPDGNSFDMIESLIKRK